jgi:hypothetical protein
LVAEPENVHDPSAVAVYDQTFHRCIGYLKRGLLARCGYSAQQLVGTATVELLTGGDLEAGKPNLGVNIRVDIKTSPWKSTDESLLQDALTDARNRIGELEFENAQLHLKLQAARNAANSVMQALVSEY